MEDIILTSEELLNIIISLQTAVLNNNLNEEDRAKHKQLIEKIKKIYSSILLSEASSVYSDNEEVGGEADEFEEEEYIFKDVDALINEADILDDGDTTKQVKVKFSLIKDNDNSFIACVETKGGEILETNIRSFKLNNTELDLYENLKDREPLFRVTLLQQNGEPH